MGYIVNPGTNETNAPVPIFNLTPSATVDEGNNWINMRWGPLALTHPVNGSMLGNYSPATGSSVINNGISLAVSGVAPPTTDFFGNQRTAPYDIGAVETAGVINRSAAVTPASLVFTTWVVGSNSDTQNVTVTNNGNVGLTGGAFTFAGPFSRVTTGAFPAGAPNCAATLALSASCTIKVRFTPTAATVQNGSLTVAYTGATVTPASVTLTGTGVGVTLAFSGPTPSLFTTPASTTAHSGTITVTNNSGASITLASNPTVTKTGGPGSRNFSIVAPASGTRCLSGLVITNGASCTIGVQYSAGTNTTTATGHVTLTDTLTGASGTATQNSPNFTAN
jgi:hypothetical protein